MAIAAKYMKNHALGLNEEINTHWSLQPSVWVNHALELNDEISNQWLLQPSVRETMR